MARLETIIDGSADGLETAASRAIGILEGLQKVADKLKIDLFQATTVEELNSVGTALTAVTGRYNDYINTALRGNSVWQDQQAAKALDTLNSKLLVVNGNAELFGRTLATDKQEVRAYQAALDAMLKAGIDPTDKRVQELTANINRLNAAIRSASSGQGNPFAQFENASGIIGNLENRLKNLRNALREATDSRQIVSLNRRLRETQDELSRLRGLGNQATGMLGRMEAEANRLRKALRFAQSERELEELGAEIRKVEGEISRLNSVAGVMNYQFGRDGRQSFNQFGLELGRVVQDLPYASTAFGAISNNFGAIGNNITRMAELFPGYIAMLQASVVASGRAATSANVLKAAFAGLFTGANAWLLGISLLVSGIQVYTALQQKARREAEKAQKAQKDSIQVLREYISTLDSTSRAQGAAAEGYAGEAAKAQLLYNQTQDLTLSTEARREALKKLKEEFPTYFSGLTDEAILAGNAANEYERLTKNLIASQTARAAEDLTTDALKEQMQLRIRERENTKQITALQVRINELNAEITKEREDYLELSRKSLDAEGSMMSASQGLLKLTDERNRLLAQQEALGRQSATDTARQERLQVQLNDYQDIFNKATEEALANLGAFPAATKKTADNTKKAADYAAQMAAAFEKATDREEVDSRTGLDAMTEKTRQKYEDTYKALESLEAKWQAKYKAGTEERMRLDALVSNYRLQLGIKEADELLRNEDRFNQEMEEKRRKALADSVNVEVDTQRRLNERRSQTMLRALNKDLREWEKAAEERVKIIAKETGDETRIRAAQLEEQEKLQRQYWERLEAIQQFERMERLANDFGDAFSRAFETSLTDGKNIFEQIYKEFRRLIIRMIAQQAALKAANIFGNLFGVGNVGDSSRGNQTNFGDLLTGIASIFGNSGAAGKWSNDLSKTFSSSGEGGRFINRLGQAFTGNNGGGGFLRTLTGLFSSASSGGGGGGGWLGKLLNVAIGAFSGSSGYSSGYFPTGNYGGGSFGTRAPITNPGFIPGGGSSMAVNVTVEGELRNNTIRLSNIRSDQENKIFFGGK